MANGDFVGRVRQATKHLLGSRRAVRLCALNDDHFFFPRGKEPFCEHCRGTRTAVGLGLEGAQERSRRFRERQTGQRNAERTRLQKSRERLIEIIGKNATNADRLRLARIDDRLAVLERESTGKPPVPPIARWEITIRFGAKASDIQVQMGPTSLQATPILPDGLEPKVSSVTLSGTYAELVSEYRAERLKGGRYYA